MGLKYRRFGVVASIMGLLLSMAGVGAATAADPPADGLVWDGTVKVLWIDRVDGTYPNASVRVFFYRDGDPIKGIMPGSWTTDSGGLATITGVPRAIPGTAPVRLDIRADLSTAVFDGAGCTTYQNWIGQSVGVRSRETVLLLLHTTYRSEPFVNCVYG